MAGEKKMFKNTNEKLLPPDRPPHRLLPPLKMIHNCHLISQQKSLMKKQNERKRGKQQSFPFYKRKLIIIFSF